MTYKAIVFDKDGTLIDFNSTWLPVYHFAALEFANDNKELAHRLLGQHGYDHIEDRVVGGSLLAAGNNHDIARAWSELLREEVDNKTLEKHSQRLNQIFQQKGAECVAPVPELKSTIQSLKKQGLKLGVATSDSYAGIENTLQPFEIMQYFDFLCGYDSGYGVKPEAGMVQAFCRLVNIDPAQTIVVGDNSHDIEMGRNAGAGLCVGVLTGTSTREELETIADHVYENIGGLLSLVADNG